jgi:hypothetical protein
MRRKYFSKLIKPVLTAARMHGAAYAAGDVLIPWTEINLGGDATVKLINATAIIRGTSGARQEQPFALWLSQDSTRTWQSLENAAVSEFPDIYSLGHISFVAGDYDDTAVSSMDLVTFATANGGNGINRLVKPLNGKKSIYMGGVAGGAFDFRSNVAVNMGAGTSTSSAVITTDTSDARTSFAVGDVIHSEDGNIQGTIKTVDSNTQITLTENVTASAGDDEKLYNISPIWIRLDFEM